jgi:hypothetical protein
VGRRREIQAGAAGFEGQDKERRAAIALEIVHQILAFADGGFAVKHEPRPAEHFCKKSGKSGGDFSVLREDEQLFLPGGNLLGKLAQALEFAAVRRAIGTIAEPLGRVIADLLESSEKREDETPPPDPVIALAGKPGFEILHRLAVQCGLRAGKAAEGVDLGLFRQVGDDALIRLHAPKDIWTHQLPKRGEG